MQIIPLHHKLKIFIFIKTLRIVKVRGFACYFSKLNGYRNHVHKPFSFSLFSPTHTNLLPNKADTTTAIFLWVFIVFYKYNAGKCEQVYTIKRYTDECGGNAVVKKTASSTWTEITGGNETCRMKQYQNTIQKQRKEVEKMINGY